MPILKPQRGIQLNKSHWASRGLVGCWVMNEGSGGAVFDLSGNGNTGTKYAGTAWQGGKFGPALSMTQSGYQLDGVDAGAGGSLNVTDLTVLVWAKPNSSASAADGMLVTRYWPSAAERIFALKLDDHKTPTIWIGSSGGGAYATQAVADSDIPYDQWSQLAFTFKDGVGIDDLFHNGQILAFTGSQTYTSLNQLDNNKTLEIGSYSDGSQVGQFYGLIDNVLIYSRALTAAEIAYLYREPFCMFDKAMSAELICSPSTVVYLTGSTIAQSSAKGWLTVSCRVPQLERFWLRDALFNGMTAEAFKLGTVLSLGWFWVRPDGCTALYRGCSIEQIDFDNILTVTGPDADRINPPTCISHEPDTVYFYLVRRFNSIGHRENTVAAAAKVAIDSNGNLKEPQPNKMYASWAIRTEGNKVRIVWFYCPLEQKSPPVCFKIYYDSGSGQIDFENPLAEVEYRGRRFYSYQSPELSTGRYLFAVRAENADGFENGSQARLKIQIDSSNPEPIEILETRNV